MSRRVAKELQRKVREETIAFSASLRRTFSSLRETTHRFFSLKHLKENLGFKISRRVAKELQRKVR